ncbi:ATP-binding protein [Amycolatopsis sp. CA-230715]|uniref:ATP-binding protein n=1 Tax=Amycolatopsis sp. CA-230715 TaxID=2745196 RepID=UPI001C32AFB7|nr:ATP-binding protein [Amycolatopsis sp. CA-230715]QWF84003.1 Signal transduction histidine-protein kinase/phosphatase MprB [Amycolatopsis sp. CA-230715]
MTGPWRLRTRIAVLSAVCVALVAASMAVAAYFFFDRELRRQLDLGLAREANRIQLLVKAGRWDATGTGDCEWIATPACSQVIAPDQQGPGAGDVPGLPVDARVRSVAAGTAEAFRTDVVVAGHPLRLLTTPLPGGRALQVAVRSDGVEQSLARIQEILLAAGAGGVLLACALGYLIARTGLRPVAAIVAATKRVTATRDPGHRIEVRGDDELAQLSRNFNAMLAALEDSVTAQRRLVADASHELRTPITSLRSDIDLLTLAGPLEPDRQQRVLDRVHAQFAELTQVVNDLIELARGDEPGDIAEEVRLDEIVEGCRARADRHWPGVAFTGDLEPTMLDGVPDRLARAVTNLLDNAAKFSPDGGTVAIRLRDRVLTVTDHGPGIAPEDVPKVFDRFYRAPAARTLPGSGLGLAIVAQVATAHGARVEVTSPEGGGTSIALRFPAPADDPG